MKQSRLASFIEQCCNTASGFLLSLAAQWWFLPRIGVAISLEQNLIFAGFMTVVSVARGYGWRRLMEALHIRTPLSAAMLAVLAERQRQKTGEGWSEDHDNKHEHGELALAGAAYLFAASIVSKERRQWLRRRTPADHAGIFSTVLRLWPWNWLWWKPAPNQDLRRDLVRGCALGLAELERFDRNRRARAPIVGTRGARPVSDIGAVVDSICACPQPRPAAAADTRNKVEGSGAA
jgi:hypothetical protein